MIRRERGDGVRVIHESADHLLALGNDILDLGLLAAAVVRTETLPLARCDAAHGYQAFTHFISNALKFTPPGGKVTVRTSLAGPSLRAEFQATAPACPPTSAPNSSANPPASAPARPAAKQATASASRS